MPHLDVVGRKAEPGEQLELLEALHGDDGVAGQVEDLQVAQLRHLEHAQQPVVAGGQLLTVFPKMNKKQK